MPYRWTETDPHRQELHLWPHQSLPPQGFVVFIGVTLSLAALPLIQVLGTALLWGLLLPMLVTLAGIWFAIHRSRIKARVLEILILTEDHAHLRRQNPDGQVQEWDCNRYWAHPIMHDDDGPVPHYVTLKGSGREVEIGAFLSEDERVALFGELLQHFKT